MDFEGRKEFFGSVFWDFTEKSLFSFDKSSTNMLDSILNASSQQDYINQLKKDKPIFIKNCEKVGLLRDDKPNFYFVKDRSHEKEILSAPLRLHFAVTSKCNLNCAHCFTRDILARDQEELSFEEKLALLDQMVDLGIREMLVSGGEPFMLRNFPEFLEEACNRKIAVKVFSNGFLLTESLIERIKEIPIDYLAVSVDGATPYTFRQVRGGPSFEKLIENIKKVSSKCVFPVVLQITMSKINHNDLENYFKLAIETGVKRIKIRALKPGGEILQHTNMMLSFEEYLAFCDKAITTFNERNYESDYGMTLDCTLGNTRLVYTDKLQLENIPQPYEGFGCVGGRVTFFVDSFGNCHPCAFIDTFLKKEKADNLKNMSLKEIWDTNENMIAMRTPKGNQECFDCDLYTVCRGGCRARSVFYVGDKSLNGKDGWCPKDAGLTIKR